MSGGHWNYLSPQLEDRGARSRAVWDLLAAIEHALDWGHSGDRCLACAEKRTLAALCAYFDTGASEAREAVEILETNDPNKRIQCADCQAREDACRHQLVPSEPTRCYACGYLSDAQIQRLKTSDAPSEP